MYKSLGYLSHTFEPSEARNCCKMTPKNMELDSIFKSCGKLTSGSANENISPRGTFSHWLPRLPIPCVCLLAWIQKGAISVFALIFSTAQVWVEGNVSKWYICSWSKAIKEVVKKACGEL